MNAIVDNWSVFQAGTNAGATATKSAVTLKQHFVVGIYGFTDLAAQVTIKSGTTVLAEWKIDPTLGPSFNFNVFPLIIDPGADAVAQVSASTSDCAITIRGFSVPSATTV